MNSSPPIDVRGIVDGLTGAPLDELPEVFVCQACSTAYSPASYDALRIQTSGKCLGCPSHDIRRVQTNTIHWKVGAQHWPQIRQASTQNIRIRVRGLRLLALCGAAALLLIVATLVITVVKNSSPRVPPIAFHPAAVVANSTPVAPPVVELSEPHICVGLYRQESGECSSDNGNNTVLTFFAKYKNAIAGTTTLTISWSIDGEALRTSTEMVPTSEGIYISTITALATGSYQATLAAPGDALVSAQLAYAMPTLDSSTLNAQTTTSPTFLEPVHDEQPSQSVTPIQTQGPAVQEEPRQFIAKHKHAIGGCEGLLQIAPGEIIFSSKSHHVRFTKHDIRAADGPGLKDVSGKNWHFQIKGLTATEVHDLFQKWIDARTDTDAK